MCLNSITTKAKKPVGTVRAFKKFLVTMNSGKITVQHSMMARTVKLDVWDKETSKLHIRGHMTTDVDATYVMRKYPRGFHAYKDRNNLGSWDGYSGRVLVPVLLRKVHTVGLQSGETAYVAKELFVSSVDVLKAMFTFHSKNVKKKR